MRYNTGALAEPKPSPASATGVAARPGEAIASVADNGPCACGSNCTCSATLAPGATANGNAGGDTTRNALPLSSVSALTSTAWLPPLASVRVAGRVRDSPTATRPKSSCAVACNALADSAAPVTGVTPNRCKASRSSAELAPPRCAAPPAT